MKRITRRAFCCSDRRRDGPVMLVQDPGEENWLHWIVVTGYRNTLVFPDRTRDREDLKCNEPGNRTSRYVGLNGVVASAKLRDVNYRCYLF